MNTLKKSSKGSSAVLALLIITCFCVVKFMFLQVAEFKQLSANAKLAYAQCVNNRHSSIPEIEAQKVCSHTCLKK